MTDQTIKQLDEQTKEIRQKMGIPSIEELQKHVAKNITKEEYTKWKTEYTKEKNNIPKMSEQNFIFKCVLLHYLVTKQKEDDGFEDCECGYSHHYEDKCPTGTQTEHYESCDDK